MSFKKFPKEELIAALREKGLTLSCAESCTGGWFAKCMVDTPGASAVFRGGVVSYATEVKEDLLGVKKQTVERDTVYSTAVACEMAKGSGQTIHLQVDAVPYHKEALTFADMGFVPAGAYRNRRAERQHRRVS